MIVSYDTIIDVKKLANSYQKPPYKMTSTIVDLISQIQYFLGQAQPLLIAEPSVQLRKQNQIRTIHHSLAIEGNSLTPDQITDLIDNKRVLGSRDEILEVQNAINVYKDLYQFNPLKEKDLKRAHALLMKQLAKTAGEYRSVNVGILKKTIKSASVGHIAPQPKMIPALMKNIFDYLNDKTEKSFLIKACVFHYELEFIHPFEDGNGRMGRLWQQLILIKHDPTFLYIPVESLIHMNQKKYYQVLEACDKLGDSTLFIEFSLEMILQSLREFTKDFKSTKPLASDRIQKAQKSFARKSFSRKDYLALFPGLSTSTASRDLKYAVDRKIIKISGDKSQAVYSFVTRVINSSSL